MSPADGGIEHLRRHHGIRISKQFLEKLTQPVGEFWLQQDDRDAQGALRGKIVPLGEVGLDYCCVFADGTMVRTDGEWHEVRVGAVRTTEGDTTRKSSIARFCDVEQFGADLWRKACECGYGEASSKAFLGDGSHWIWSIAGLHFSEAVQILDWYHLAEHLSKCGNEMFGEGTQDSQAWAGKMRQMMEKGHVQRALEEVEKLSGRGKNRCQAKHELITYLTNNRERMDYPRYRALGFPISSGDVEAECKDLVQARCNPADGGMEHQRSRTGLTCALRLTRRQLRQRLGLSQRVPTGLAQTPPARAAEASRLRYHQNAATPSNTAKPSDFIMLLYCPR